MPNITYKLAKEKLEKKVRGYIGEDIFDIHYAENEVCNIRGAKIKEGCSYLMRYFPSCNIIAVWNVDLNQKEYGYHNCVVSQVNMENGCCKVLYNKRRNGKTEKTVIISEDFLFDFLDDYYAFMKINDYDNIEENGKIFREEDIGWANKEERAKRSVYQKARDKKFRESVLKRYMNKCAICRCSIPQLLDAAHERGFEVCNTSIDNVKHGVCLCKNHHAMYDKKIDNTSSVYLIDLDLKHGELIINHHSVKKMPWYPVFMTEYNGKLLEPKENK